MPPKVAGDGRGRRGAGRRPRRPRCATRPWCRTSGARSWRSSTRWMSSPSPRPCRRPTASATSACRSTSRPRPSPGPLRWRAMCPVDAVLELQLRVPVRRGDRRQGRSRPGPAAAGQRLCGDHAGRHHRHGHAPPGRGGGRGRRHRRRAPPPRDPRHRAVSVYAGLVARHHPVRHVRRRPGRLPVRRRRRREPRHRGAGRAIRNERRQQGDSVRSEAGLRLRGYTALGGTPPRRGAGDLGGPPGLPQATSRAAWEVSRCTQGRAQCPSCSHSLAHTHTP